MWTSAIVAVAILVLLCLLEDSFVSAFSSAPRNSWTSSAHDVWTTPRGDAENKYKTFGFVPTTASTVLSLASSSSSSASSTLEPRRRLENTSNRLIEIGPLVGCGSYGTVHRVAFMAAHGDDEPSTKSFSFIGKRAWNANDLADLLGEAATPQQLREKESRCRYYWDVEAHCFAKLEKKQVTNNKKNTNTEQSIKDVASRQCVPPFRGIFKDNANGDEWMVFDLIPVSTTKSLLEQLEAKNENENKDDLFQPAPTLQELMNMDRNSDHDDDEDHHHLFFLSQALGISSSPPPSTSDDETDSSSSLTKTLDVVIEQVLEILTTIHAQNIVHRDIKPSNLLVVSSDDKQQQQQKLLLIDFGSAADLDTAGPGPFAKKIGLVDQRVAISPIYAAPELFINVEGGGQYAQDVACTFDCFSAGLLFCQLLFQYLDELTDTGFRQQLESANWNLNTWLQFELGSKFRPRNSLQNALQVLAERPGLWSLLQDLLQADPRDRCSSKRALKRWKEIRNNQQQTQATTSRTTTATTTDVEDETYVDGAYLQEVLQSMDICIISEDDTTTSDFSTRSTVSAVSSTTPPTISTRATLTTDTEELVLSSRPLQYVATFRRKESLGLLLAEAFDEENKVSAAILEEMTNESHRAYWQHVIVPHARPREVYIYGIVPSGQADEMGIFEVGVRVFTLMSLLLPMQRVYHAANR
jgi:serine/threonine protein kinase